MLLILSIPADMRRSVIIAQCPVSRPACFSTHRARWCVNFFTY